MAEMTKKETVRLLGEAGFIKDINNLTEEDKRLRDTRSLVAKFVEMYPWIAKS